MAGKPRVPDAPTTDAKKLTHNPFSALRTMKAEVRKAPEPAPPAPPKEEPAILQPKADELAFPDRLTLREEPPDVGRSARTRIRGIPKALFARVAEELKKAFGCNFFHEGDELILVGSFENRAALWFEQHGALNVTTSRPRISYTKEGPKRVSSADPTLRRSIRTGQLVAIVLKIDQPTGALTEGEVAEILTPTPDHPRGIKVRLTSGQVGRVKKIYL